MNCVYNHFKRSNQAIQRKNLNLLATQNSEWLA
jgi:hypothetical protein